MTFSPPASKVDAPQEGMIIKRVLIIGNLKYIYLPPSFMVSKHATFLWPLNKVTRPI